AISSDDPLRNHRNYQAFSNRTRVSRMASRVRRSAGCNVSSRSAGRSRNTAPPTWARERSIDMILAIGLGVLGLFAMRRAHRRCRGYHGWHGGYGYGGPGWHGPGGWGPPWQ